MDVDLSKLIKIYVEDHGWARTSFPVMRMERLILHNAMKYVDMKSLAVARNGERNLGCHQNRWYRQQAQHVYLKAKMTLLVVTHRLQLTVSTMCHVVDEPF